MKRKLRRVETSRSKNPKFKINWDELDRCYAEQYESDYGYLFRKSKILI